MRIVKIIIRCFFWLLILALMAAPLYLITEISKDEVADYAVPEPPELVVTSVGRVMESFRTDVPVEFTVSGNFTSTTYAYQELTYKNLDRTRWYVRSGEEIQEGQVLGVLKGEEILAQYSGILVEMNTYGLDPYLRILLLEPVELECRVNDRVLSMLRRSQTLLTEDDEAVTLVYASRQKNSDGTTNVRLSIDTDKYTYGLYLPQLKIYTDQIYRDVVVLSTGCVYQTNPGEDQPWYVREVTRDGVFLREIEVKLGYESNGNVTVTGINEGQYFDSGYKAVVEGS